MDTAWTNIPSYGFRPFVRNLLIKLDKICPPTRSKHINLRTRIKRLVRRTICFSKTECMHDLVIGLFINRYEFGVAV